MDATGAARMTSRKFADDSLFVKCSHSAKKCLKAVRQVPLEN